MDFGEFRIGHGSLAVKEGDLLSDLQAQDIGAVMGVDRVEGRGFLLPALGG